MWLAHHAQETTYDASFNSTVKEAIPINVLVGQSRVINFDRPIGRFSISNPEIAEAVMVRPDQVLVNGKGFGQVNFIAWEKNDSQIHRLRRVCSREPLAHRFPDARAVPA